VVFEQPPQDRPVGANQVGCSTPPICAVREGSTAISLVHQVLHE
jgi:hypothetical protein